jgi:integrase
MGTFYIGKGRRQWRLIHETYENGKRVAKQVPRDALIGFGFSPDLSLEQAKARAKQLNQSQKLEREKQVDQARRAARIQVVESVYLPQDLAGLFTEHLEEESFGGDEHKLRLQSHWKYIQDMIAELEIHPQDFHRNANRIYRYLIEDEVSIDYAGKLIRVLNLWGLYVSEKRQAFFRPVALPRGLVRERIADNHNSTGVRKASAPLPPAVLESARQQLTVVGNYEWLYVSVWLGLRPEEVDQLRDRTTWKTTTIRGATVIQIYQSKLVRVPKNQRWKSIPLITKQQERALEFIESGVLKRPLYKTMATVFGEGITLYGGRKGFVRLMKDHGQNVNNISQWLGHKSVNRTKFSYEEFDDVRFDPVKRTKAS